MKKITALGLSAAAYLTLALPALAVQKTVSTCPTGTFAPLCSLQLTDNFLPNLITLAFVLAVVIALGFLIYGGIRWIMSGGEKEGVEEARKMIVAALVGLVVVFLSYFLLNFVFSLFGLTFKTVFNISVFSLFK